MLVTEFITNKLEYDYATRLRKSITIASFIRRIKVNKQR